MKRKMDLYLDVETYFKTFKVTTRENDCLHKLHKYHKT